MTLPPINTSPSLANTSDKSIVVKLCLNCNEKCPNYNIAANPSKHATGGMCGACNQKWNRMAKDQVRGGEGKGGGGGGRSARQSEDGRGATFGDDDDERKGLASLR